MSLIRFMREMLCENTNELEPLWSTPEPEEKTKVHQILSVTSQIFQSTGLVLLAPYALASLVLKEPDRNPLRPEKLTGIKVISWVHESDIDVPMYDTLKEIRRKYSGTRYNEVVAAIVSRGLKSYFDAKTLTLPKYVTIAIPEQIERPGKIYF